MLNEEHTGKCNTEEKKGKTRILIEYAGFIWCRLPESNWLPDDYKSTALPSELSRRNWNNRNEIIHYFIRTRVGFPPFFGEFDPVSPDMSPAVDSGIASVKAFDCVSATGRASKWTSKAIPCAFSLA